MPDPAGVGGAATAASRPSGRPPPLRDARSARSRSSIEELRKQVGQTFTLAELADAYRDADRWAREVVEERAPSPGWPRDLALVLAAAFHAISAARSTTSVTTSRPPAPRAVQACLGG